MQAIIGSILRELLKKLDAELVKDLVDGLLDKVEDKVKATETQWDDVTILPLIASLRSITGIKDENYGSDKNVSSDS